MVSRQSNIELYHQSWRVGATHHDFCRSSLHRSEKIDLSSASMSAHSIVQWDWLSNWISKRSYQQLERLRFSWGVKSSHLFLMNEIFLRELDCLTCSHWELLPFEASLSPRGSLYIPLFNREEILRTLRPEAVTERPNFHAPKYFCLCLHWSGLSQSLSIQSLLFLCILFLVMPRVFWILPKSEPPSMP